MTLPLFQGKNPSLYKALWKLAFILHPNFYLFLSHILIYLLFLLCLLQPCWPLTWSSHESEILLPRCLSNCYALWIADTHMLLPQLLHAVLLDFLLALHCTLQPLTLNYPSLLLPHSLPQMISRWLLSAHLLQLEEWTLGQSLIHGFLLSINNRACSQRRLGGWRYMPQACQSECLPGTHDGKKRTNSQKLYTDSNMEWRREGEREGGIF